MWMGPNGLMVKDVGNLSGFDYLSVVLFWEKAAFM